MNLLFSFIYTLRNVIRLSPLHQFLLNLLVPVAGILLFQWTPGNVLFGFGITMVNYWLANLVLLLFFIKKEQAPTRISRSLQFSFYFLLSLAGFYFFVDFLAGHQSHSIAITMRSLQVLLICLLYWLQFWRYLQVTRPAGRIDADRLTKDISYRLTGIYLTLFCIIGYLFSFWSGTNVMNYALAFALIFACSLTDLVLIAVKMPTKSLP